MNVDVVLYYLIESYSLFYGIYGRIMCDMYGDTKKNSLLSL